MAEELRSSYYSGGVLHLEMGGLLKNKRMNIPISKIEMIAEGFGDMKAMGNKTITIVLHGGKELDLYGPAMEIDEVNEKFMGYYKAKIQ